MPALSPARLEANLYLLHVTFPLYVIRRVWSRLRIHCVLAMVLGANAGGGTHCLYWQPGLGLDGLGFQLPIPLSVLDFDCFGLMVLIGSCHLDGLSLLGSYG